VLTFNQEQHILKTLKSIGSQKCNFNMEVIIADDNSPDNTKVIVQRFLNEYKKNNIEFKYFRHDLNKGVSSNLIWSLKKSLGKYIAFCEGDDYWLNDDKIQSQFNFLESNPSIKLHCSSFKLVKPNGYEEIINHGLNHQIKFNLNFLKKKWITKFVTVMIKKSSIDFKEIEGYNNLRDIQLFYTVLKNGDGFYSTDINASYNLHGNGLHSSNIGLKNLLIAREIYQELYSKNKDEFSRFSLVRINLNIISYSLYNFNFSLLSPNLLKQSLILISLKKDFSSIVKSVYPKFFKK
jgi:glycosyltransferase involved in cell wall biosynthesis